MKESSTLILGLNNSSSDVGFSHELNGTRDQESYTQENKSVDLGLAFSTDEVGLQAYASKKSYLGKFQDDRYEEASDSYDILTSIQMNIIDALYVGFSMNWNISSGNIYGSDVGEDNDLGFRERSTQMAAGLNYDKKNYSLGVFYRFLAKGKFQVSGEEKLVTDPSVIGFNSNYSLTNQIALGLSYARYQYGEDETRDRYSNDDDNRMSLKGLGFEEYYYHDYIMRADLQYTHTPKLYANFGVIYDKGFFYADSDEKEIESGTPSANLSYEIVGHAEFNKLYIEAMIQLNQLSSSSIEDDEMKNGFSLVEGYKRSTQQYGLSIGIPF